MTAFTTTPRTGEAISASSLPITSLEEGATEVEHLQHGPSILIDKRKSFHFPPSVLAFFQEEYPTTIEDDRLDLDTGDIGRNTSIDNNNDQHLSLEKVRPSGDVATNTTTTPMAQQHGDTEQEPRDSVGLVVMTNENEGCNNNNSRPKNSPLQSCLDLLSSQDLDLNRVALQRLFLLTKGRTAIASSGNKSEMSASMILVYGGQTWGSLEDQLRYAFCTMICDAPHGDVGVKRASTISTSCIDIEDDDENESRLMSLEARMDGKNVQHTTYRKDGEDDDEWDGSIYSADSMSSGPDDETPQGKSWGALHLQGLKVLANALTQISYSILNKRDHNTDVPTKGNPLRHRKIPLDDTVWRNIIHSLVHNIETNHTADVTGYSLKILRLLHAIHPDMVQPLLQHTLFPYLVYLQEYGHNHLFPMIHSEATYLLRRANYLW